MVSLRWAQPEDLPAFARISAVCFPGPEEAARLERIRQDPRYGVGDVLVAEKAGRMAGGATLLPMRVWTGGVELAAGGVASVQVDPDFRRRGIAQTVMQRLLEAHGERGYCLSLLHPYDPAFYRRLGYAMLVRWVELRLRPRALPFAEAALAVRTATDADFEAVVECHGRSLAAHNGGITRSAEFWKARVWIAPRRVAVFENDGRIEGYFIYELQPTRDHLQQVLHVREWVAPGGEALHALLGYIHVQRAQCPEVRLFAPVDWAAPLFLAEPRSPAYDNPESGCYSSGTTGTGPMGRVQDLRALFAAGRRFDGPSLVCRFSMVESAFAHDGDRSGRLGQEVTVEFNGERASETERPASAWLACDPGTMAQLYFGAVSPRDAVRWGFARVDSDATLDKLDRLFVQPAPFTHPLDYF